METRDLESKLGKFRAAYSAGGGKVVLNLIVALFWWFLGFILFSMLWDDYGSRFVAVVVGLVFLTSGAAYVIVPYRRRAGRRARLYEEGIWVSVRGKAQSWRFDEIDGVRVVFGGSVSMADAVSDGVGAAVGGVVGALAAGVVKGALEATVSSDGPADPEINRYQFYVGDERAFDIGPEYKRWKELGRPVYRAVMERLVARLVERLGRGEQVVFDGLTSRSGKTSLTLTRESIQEKDGDPVPWANVRGVAHDRETFLATVKTPDEGTNIVFGADSALNALVALDVVKAMIRNAQSG
jgi:hypothetical protein